MKKRNNTLAVPNLQLVMIYTAIEVLYTYLWKYTCSHIHTCTVFYTEETLFKFICVFHIIINLFLFELSVDAGVAGTDLTEENVGLQ